MKTRTGYLVKRGGTYYACWTINGKKFRKTTGTGDRRDAEKELARIMQPFLIENDARLLETVRARIEGTQAELAAIEETNNPPLTISAAWGAYRNASATQDITKGTLRNYEGYWTAFSEWAKTAHKELTDLRHITAAVAEEYWQHLGALGVTGRTCNAHRAFLRAFWGVLCEPARLATNYTLKDGTQTRNPWATIKPRDENSVSRRPFTVEELRNVCRTAEGELRTMLAFGLYAGARMGDAACMDWAACDMVRREIRFLPRKTRRKVKKALVVPMHPELYAVLAETPPEDRRGPVCPDMAARYVEKGQGPVSAIVQRHLEACGLVITAEREGAGQRRVVAAGFHSLRHTYVSLLRNAGAAQSVSESLAGHNSAEVHRLYSHTDMDTARRAVAALPAVIGNAAPEPKPKKTVDAAAVRAIAKTLNAETWKDARKKLLALAAGKGAI